MTDRPSLPERIDAFYLEQRLCRRLDGAVETDASRIEYVALRRSCGASLVRRAAEPVNENETVGC